MEFIRNTSRLNSRHQGCVATIGNFDGVHLGHQAVLRQLKAKAKLLQLPILVIIFEPQPQEFFTPNSAAPARLTRLREKLLAMHRNGVERVLCVDFDSRFARLSTECFIHQLLVKSLQVKHIVIGDDFHFGHGRQGNFTTLQQAGRQHNFSVETQNTFFIDGERVSSTRIRQVLKQSDIQQATKLLGRPYTFCGRIGYGQQRGRTIGFPTANIFIHRHVSPLLGVFAVFLHGVADQPLAGVANLGTRPTIDGKKLLLEVHILNFDKQIYGHYVEVEFVKKLRSEQKFVSFEALKQQIEIDVQLAKVLFNSME
ncbi:bifunctional riboflavin kinase/FAD synthetase [Thiotrichales bacterium HSG1]|nr:bifunctional riboflavin kinase/FAD synthetase [Thiotrichales bacterium HSG1]